MSTKVNIKRPGTGLVKLEVTHNGTKAIRSNLRASLFGTTGETRRHIVEVRELATSVSEPCLTVPDVPPIFFRVFGRHQNTLVRNIDGTFNHTGHFLGDRASIPNKLRNGAINGIPEAEFEMRVPTVYSIRDLLWKMTKKINRINDIFVAHGWTNLLGVQVNGMLDGGLGTLGYDGTALVSQILPTQPVEEQKMPEENFIELHFDASGYLAFQGSDDFWNACGIWCSPYFRKLTGFDEIIVRTLDVWGEDNSTNLYPPPAPINQFVHGGQNTAGAFITSPKNLYNTFEERESILITSDIPCPPERNIVNGDDRLRYVFAHFDLKGIHDHTGGRTIINGAITNNWYIEGTNIVGMQLMDSPKETGFASLVLPTVLPSINVRALLRRKIWNFETNTYSTEEIPLLQSDIDQLILRLNFTLQM